MMTLEEFTSKYSTTRNMIPSLFMRISAVSWIDWVRKKTDGQFAPDVNYLLKFSDASNTYEYDYNREHKSVNRNVTVGELLRIADLMFYTSYSYTNGKLIKQMQDDAIYIVNSLLVRPFTLLSGYAAETEPSPPARNYGYGIEDEQYCFDDEEYWIEDGCFDQSDD